MRDLENSETLSVNAVAEIRLFSNLCGYATHFTGTAFVGSVKAEVAQYHVTKTHLLSKQCGYDMCLLRVMSTESKTRKVGARRCYCVFERNKKTKSRKAPT